MVFRAGALENAAWCPTGINAHALERFPFESDRDYAPDNEAVSMLREADFLDSIRLHFSPMTCRRCFCKAARRGRRLCG